MLVGMMYVFGCVDGGFSCAFWVLEEGMDFIGGCCATDREDLAGRRWRTR